jgi:outer membrane protein assembly factor BamA
MWFPIIDQADGYGPRFGVRFAYVPSARSKSRFSMPLTWGGERRAGLEWEKGFEYGRLQVGGALTSTKHPYYDERDGRRRVWARLEGTARRVHVGGTATLQRINFGGNVDKVKTIGADVTLDTRLDPVLPRNAIYVFASAEQVRLTPDQGAAWDPYVRRKVDASVYLGVIKQAVLVGRVLREDATARQPLYFQPMLGGMGSLRGYETASFVGDTLMAGTLELRVPITSPISVGKFGVRTFIDRGAVYSRGQRFKDQDLKQGYGGGIFFALPTFSMNLDLAYSSEKKVRLHFTGGFSF